MNTKLPLYPCVALFLFAISAQAADIRGGVTGPNGPEAGVWVIAETKDLPTNFIKIVVTDDRGRFTVPELPGANYSVWASPRTDRSRETAMGLCA